MRSIIFTSLLLAALFVLPVANAMPWIAGYVENALDGTSPNGRTVRVWNPLTSDEGFDTIGPTGNSLTSNVFMVDCDMFPTPCEAGDKLNITIVDDASGYVSKKNVEIIVPEGGFYNAGNFTMNSPPSFTNLTVEDILTSPENEIDLTPATTTTISCSGIIEDYEGDNSFQGFTSEFYSSASNFGQIDDKNDHYTNNSCEFDESYGSSIQGKITCTFDIEYYANATSWDCQINATDNYSASITYSDTTKINTLLALGVNDTLNYSTVDAVAVSPELTAEIINYGNIKMNLTLSGYGAAPGDGNSMNCSEGNISIYYTKYNVTSSNTGPMDLSEFETKYTNLTSDPVVEKYNLNYRTNDISNDAKNDTYWRVYLPNGIKGPCSGNIVFGATQS